MGSYGGTVARDRGGAMGRGWKEEMALLIKREVSITPAQTSHSTSVYSISLLSG